MLELVTENSSLTTQTREFYPPTHDEHRRHRIEKQIQDLDFAFGNGFERDISVSKPASHSEVRGNPLQVWTADWFPVHDGHWRCTGGQSRPGNLTQDTGKVDDGPMRAVSKKQRTKIGARVSSRSSHLPVITRQTLDMIGIGSWTQPTRRQLPGGPVPTLRSVSQGLPGYGLDERRQRMNECGLLSCDQSGLTMCGLQSTLASQPSLVLSFSKT